MIAVDVTPLALGRRRGVARALLTLLVAWAERSPGSPVRLFSPGPLPPDVPTLDGVVTPRLPAVGTDCDDGSESSNSSRCAVQRWASGHPVARLSMKEKYANFQIQPNTSNHHIIM